MLNANEPTGKYTVQIANQSFPATQTLSEHTHLVLTVRNTSAKTIPDISATLCNVTCQFPAPAGEGTSAQPFADCGGQTGAACLQSVQQSGSASLSTQDWVVDKPPGGCTGTAGYSCQGGSYGAAVTLDANTWALGPLKPNETATFTWAVTAVAPGHHVVAWEVSAGLNGKAKAVLSDGSIPSGTFPVTVNTAPSQSYVNNAGQIVTTP